MTETLTQRLGNLRDAIRAAEGAASSSGAPSTLQVTLSRSARLLDQVFGALTVVEPDHQLRFGHWIHTALEQGVSALLAWNAWIDAKPLPAA
jgi:hypothetical protein